MHDPIRVARETLDVWERFAQFHQINPWVYATFKARALRLMRRGEMRYSAEALVHDIRWNFDGDGNGPTKVKLSNTWAPFYARMFLAEFPEHKDFFRCNASIADPVAVDPRQLDLFVHA